MVIVLPTLGLFLVAIRPCDLMCSGTDCQLWLLFYLPWDYSGLPSGLVICCAVELTASYGYCFTYPGTIPGSHQVLWSAVQWNWLPAMVIVLPTLGLFLVAIRSCDLLCSGNWLPDMVIVLSTLGLFLVAIRSRDLLCSGTDCQLWFLFYLYWDYSR